MAEELKWSNTRKENEWKNSVAFLASMGLPKSKLGLTRKDVEAGRVGKYADEEYHLYARHGKSTPNSGDVDGDEACEKMFELGIMLNKLDADKPDELLESDSKYPKGSNPVVGRESEVNK
jgi:glycerol-3-phosphate dehydrogenase